MDVFLTAFFTFLLAFPLGMLFALFLIRMNPMQANLNYATYWKRRHDELVRRTNWKRSLG